MLRQASFRSIALVLGAILVSACSDPAITGPELRSADLGAQLSKGKSFAPGVVDQVQGAAELELRAVWWNENHKSQISVSKTIDSRGGTISIPETGLTMQFPAGAVTAPIRITVTADEKYVAYKMDPAGTKFLKDVTVTQSLNATELAGRPLRSLLYAAYIADDNIKLSGKVPVLEIEPSKTIFSPLSALFPEAHVWIIRHFSRYMLASG
jgi:hypothetical protein